MAKVFFRLVMPERELVATEADMVVVPGSEGDFGVLHGHAPLISTVRPGVLEVFQGNKAEQLAERERAAERELSDAVTDVEKAAAQKELTVAKDLRRAQAYYANR